LSIGRALWVGASYGAFSRNEIVLGSRLQQP